MKLLQKIITPFLLGMGILSMSPLLSRDLPTDISLKDKPATLKVLLVDGADKLFVEARGRYNLYNLNDNLLIDTGTFGKKGELLPVEQGIKWGETIKGIEKVRLVPGDSQSSILVDGIQYKGCVEFINESGKLYAINEIDVEHYLRSTLAPKFTENLPDEAMEAVAIVARTNAYFFLKQNAEKPWHIRGDAVGYQGYATSFKKPAVDRALEKTRFVVMKYNGHTFPAYWTKNSAGQTTTFSKVFRKEALVPPGVKVPMAALDKEKNSWTYEISKDRLSDLIQTKRVSGLDLYCDSESGKVYGVKVNDGTNSQDIPFTKFQKLVGDNHLLSNDFTVTSKLDKIVFKGHGEGLGMGLCLDSAKKMSERGDKSSAILNAFFPDVQIVAQKGIEE